MTLNKKENILIASGAHKNFLSSIDAGRLIKSGIEKARPQWTTQILSVGDGGDSTLDTVVSMFDGRYVDLPTINPLGEEIKTRVGVIDQLATGVVEIIDVAGAGKVTNKEWNTITNTSFGLGLLINALVEMNLKKIHVCLGGSIVSDGGIGMAQAMGVKFFDNYGKQLYPFKERYLSCQDLQNIASIDDSGISDIVEKVEITTLSDVNIPLLGKNGQANTFGPQKHANEDDIIFIEKSLQNWSNVLCQKFDKNFDISLAGAAGGIASGLNALLRSKLVLGIDYILDLISFNELVKMYDLIITGEGRLDRTTDFGKCCNGIAKRCAQLGKPYYGIFGRIDYLTEDFGNKYIDASLHNKIHDEVPRFFSKKAIVDASMVSCTTIEKIIKSSQKVSI